MNQDEIIRRLSRGEGFGGVAPERIDTHISTIFLIGDDAYKLKHALVTSYLDYSTLADRHRLCVAEIDINRRTAPQLYLDVTPVRLTEDNRLIVGEGSGSPVEWLVHMRRFAQGNLFDDLAKDGRLTPALMIELADEIAAFHASAEIVEEADASWRIGGVIDQNARELKRWAADFTEPAETEHFEQSCRSMFDDVRNTIDRRGAQGFVRRCHGDLHLRNICLIDAKPTLFDAIEFSDNICNIDVLFDLAFLIMDLHHRGMGAEANVVFNRYLYRTGDIDDLAIFPLYQALRAGIRAHVSAMAAAGCQDPEDRAIQQQGANSYLRLGRRQLEKTAPQLVAIGGLSGSGKSTIARDIAPHTGPAPGALILSSDLTRKKLLGVEPLTRLTGAAYNSETDQAVYRELMEAAMRAFAAGYSVVLDATFIDPAQRQNLVDVARQVKTNLKGFWLEARAEAIRDRVRQRVNDPSDATLSVLENQLANDPGVIDWQRIDATQSRNAIASAIRRVIHDRTQREGGEK